MRTLPGILFLLILASSSGAQEPAKASVLKKGARVAVVGDSITEQKLYSKYIETYLLACLPELDLRVIQLGWSGETAPGFANRMNNDLMPWRPDVVTTSSPTASEFWRAWTCWARLRWLNTMKISSRNGRSRTSR